MRSFIARMDKGPQFFDILSVLNSDNLELSESFLKLELERNQVFTSLLSQEGFKEVSFINILKRLLRYKKRKVILQAFLTPLV